MAASGWRWLHEAGRGHSRHVSLSRDASWGRIRRISVSRSLASLMPASWNHLAGWLRAVDQLRNAT